MSNIDPSSAYFPAHLDIREYLPEHEILLLRREVQAALELNDRLIQHKIKIEEECRRLEEENRQLILDKQKLEKQCNEDGMTGLFNAECLSRMGPQIHQEEAEKGERKSKGRMIVCYLDVNGLKSINDNFGHNAGDQLIKTFAAALRDKFRRKSDEIIFRKGGDEFVMILKNATSAYVRESIHSINDNTNFIFEGKRIQVKTSFGFAIFKGQDFDTLLKQADKSLYKNKELNISKKEVTSVLDLSSNRSPAPLPPHPA